MFKNKKIYIPSTVCIYAFFFNLSHNKQRLSSNTKLNGMFLFKDRQCAYNVTFTRVSATTVAVGKAMSIT